MKLTLLDRLRFPNYTPTDSTGSQACLALAKQWLESCIHKHTTCARPKALHGWKPKRLIDIDPQRSSLQLCSSQTIQDGFKYVTLSHHWSPSTKRCMLLSENLTVWMEALPEQDLNQTIRDAIQVTRSLGIKYIWIDALCIIQNSEEDWLAQSIQMDKIYKHSYCNIAAAGSMLDNQGCFFTRDPNVSLPLRFNLDDNTRRGSDYMPNSKNDSEDTGYGSSILKGSYDLHEHDLWIGSIDLAPLNSRAWVVQEACHIQNRLTSAVTYQCLFRP